ncbi:MAG: TadE family protein [Steroidobacteraceae bacterium]
MKARSHQRGLAIVEFALTAPFLTMLLLATAELSRAFIQYATLAHSVRDGVVHLSRRALPDTTGVVRVTSAVVTETRNVVMFGNTAGTGTLKLPGLAAGQITVSDAGAGNVRVQVNYSYQSLLGGSLPMMGYGSNLSTNFTLRVDNTMRAL